MELHKPVSFGDSPPQPVERVAFDLLRAIVGARQSAMVTVRLLGGSASDREATAPAERLSTIDLLNGRSLDNGTQPGPGAFCSNLAAAGISSDRPDATLHPARGEKQ